MGRCIAIIAGFLAGSDGFAHGQGVVFFSNRYTSIPHVIAPVYGIEQGGSSLILRGNASTNGGSTVYSGPLLIGTGYTAALYGGPAATTNPNDLVLVATAPFRAQGPLAGFIVPPATAPAVPGVPSGSYAAFQLRVWDNKNGSLTNWFQALADRTAARGSSAMFAQTKTLEPGK